MALPNTLLYKPNLIGYLRLLLLLIAIPLHSATFLLTYFSSVFLDYFDGLAARTFNETSRLGACLDMITDRTSTTVICSKIIALQPTLAFPLLTYVYIDLISHFLFFIAMLLGNTHHKHFTGNALIRFYYSNLVLKTLCCGSELYFMALFWQCSAKGAQAPPPDGWVAAVAGPAVKALAVLPIVKAFFHIVHLGLGMVLLGSCE